MLFRDLLESVQEGAGIMKASEPEVYRFSRLNIAATNTVIDDIERIQGYMKASELEDLLMLEIEAAGLPTPKRQYKFHSSRKFLADFAFVEHRLIVEVNGMTHVASRGHTSFSGIHRDYEKNNCAQLMGYVYLQFDKEMVEDGTAIRAICDYLGRCEE